MERQMEFIVNQQARASLIVTNLSLEIAALKATVEAVAAAAEKNSLAAEKNTFDIAALQDSDRRMNRTLDRVVDVIGKMLDARDEERAEAEKRQARTDAQLNLLGVRVDNLTAAIQQYVTQSRNGNSTPPTPPTQDE